MIRDLSKIDLDEKAIKMIEKGWGIKTANDVLNHTFYYNSDEYTVKGYLSFPRNISGKLPVIIWNRGGNDKSGLLDDFLACGILGEIASWGYVVFASQYRVKDEFGGNDVNDVINLIIEAKKFDLSDGNLIGMEGWSRGGMMSYLTLTKTEEIKACVAVAGISDLIKNENRNQKLGKVFKSHFGSENQVEFEKRKIERSAVFWPERISKNTRILFIHGNADDKVLTSDSTDLYNKLIMINDKSFYRLKLIEGGDHYLRNNRKEVSALRKSWFDENLKIKK